MKTLVALVFAPFLLLVVAGCGGGSVAAEANRVKVIDAFITEGSMALAVYLDLDNHGRADRIVGADLVGDSAGLAAKVTLHQTAERDGLSIMEPTDGIDIAGETDGALRPGDAHIMLEDVSREVTTDDLVSLRLDLDRAEDMTIEIRVVTADDAVALLTKDTP